MGAPFSRNILVECADGRSPNRALEARRQSAFACPGTYLQALAGSRTHPAYPPDPVPSLKSGPPRAAGVVEIVQVR